VTAAAAAPGACVWARLCGRACVGVCVGCVLGVWGACVCGVCVWGGGMCVCVLGEGGGSGVRGSSSVAAMQQRAQPDAASTWVSCLVVWRGLRPRTRARPRGIPLMACACC
jgi:hypothetical protein